MNKLPKGWEWKTIGEITECLDSKRIPVTKSKREEGEVPYYGANGIQGYVKEYIFDEELLLLAEDGGSWGKNQKCVNIIRGKSWVNNHAHVLRMRPSVLIKFLELYLNMTDLTKYISGTTRGKLNQKQMNNIQVPLPSLPVQKKIVSILEMAERLKQRRRKANEETSKIIRSVFYEMFGKIENTAHLKDVADVIMGQSPPSKTYNKKNKGLPFFQGKAEFGEKYPTVKKYCSEPLKKARKEDILMSVRAPVGSVNMAENDCCIGRGLCAIRIKKNRVVSEYVFQFFKVNEKMIEQKGQGSTFKAINRKEVENIELPVPSIELQNQFASIVEIIESLKQRQDKSTQDINQLFDALMQKAFNGELVR